MIRGTSSFAPGRVCLLGDKSDLMNHPVIAAAITKFLRFDIKPIDTDEIRFSYPAMKKRFTRPIGTEIDDEFFKFLSKISWKLKDKITPFECIVTGDLPVGSGLSSSAACSVGFIRGLNKMYKLGMDNRSIAELAFQVERNDLGIMCGRMDQYSIAFGGVTIIETGDETKVTNLPIKSLPLIIGDSCEPRAAKEVLNRTMSLLRSGDREMHSCFNRIHENVMNGVDAIKVGDLPAIGKLMNIHQEIEREMKASTPKLDRMCAAALAAGALGAKQIGAGGGGCMISLVEGSPERVERAIQEAGGRTWLASIYSNASSK